MANYTGILKDKDGNNLYPEPKIQRYIKRGIIGQGADKNINIYGYAQIFKYNPTLYIIKWSGQVTLNQASSSSDTFNWGIDIYPMREATGTVIYPVEGVGQWRAYNSSGNIIRNLLGYGTTIGALPWGGELRFASLARMYELTNFNYGSWSASNFPVNTYLEGWFLATEER